MTACWRHWDASVCVCERVAYSIIMHPSVMCKNQKFKIAAPRRTVEVFVCVCESVVIACGRCKCKLHTIAIDVMETASRWLLFVCVCVLVTHIMCLALNGDSAAQRLHTKCVHFNLFFIQPNAAHIIWTQKCANKVEVPFLFLTRIWWHSCSHVRRARLRYNHLFALLRCFSFDFSFVAVVVVVEVEITPFRCCFISVSSCTCHVRTSASEIFWIFLPR